MTLSAITTNSATISWTAPTQGTPAGYQWEVVASGAGQFSTPIATNIFTGTSTSVSTGSVLSPGTTYDVYVKTGCSLTDTSAWSSVASFTTSCYAITSLPWTEGFEGLTTVGNNILPNCWSYTNNTTVTTNVNYSCAATCNTNTAHTGTHFIGGSWYFNVWGLYTGFPAHCRYIL